MRHVRLTRLKKEILQPHPSPGHGERKRPPALSHTGNLGSSVHPPGPPGSRDPWEKNLRQRNEIGQRPDISDTNRAKNEKNQRPKTRLGLPIFTLATDRAPEPCVVIVVMRSLRF